jgi:hypothetical protein
LEISIETEESMGAIREFVKLFKYRRKDMKELPHHIKKLNRKVIRSAKREEAVEEEMPSVPARKPTERQVKKQAKEKIKQSKKARAPSALSPEEKNKKMKKRVPVFDREKAKPKSTKPTRKKTPRI